MAFLQHQQGAAWRAMSVAAVLASFGAAQAATFEPTWQSRSVHIGADIAVWNIDGNGGGSGSAGDSFITQPGDFSAMDKEVGLDGGSLGGVGFAGGRAVQRSSYGGERIDFYGFGDIYVSVAATGDFITGGGAASVYFSTIFQVTRPTWVQLDMTSTPSNFGSDFLFALSKSGGGVVWAQSSVEQDGFPPAYSFTRSFWLEAGSYNMGASLLANFPLDGAGDSRMEAAFSLVASAVPEPQGWALLLAGLGVVGAAVRRQAA